MHEITLQDVPDDAGKPVSYTLHMPAGWDDGALRPHHLLCVSKALLLLAIATPEVAPVNEEEDPFGIAQPDPAPNDEAMTLVRLELLRELSDMPAELAARLPLDPDHFYYEVDTTDHNSAFVVPETSEYRLLPQLDWCFTPPKFKPSLLPSIEHGGILWNGPPDDFTNMAMLQWLWCVYLTQQFRAGNKDTYENDLNSLLGALYHPAEGAGTWHNRDIEENAARLSNLDLEVKLAAVMNFEAIHATLPDTYHRVFDPRGEAMNSPAGVFGMAFDVAQSGVLGKESEVNTVPVHKVLLFMEHNLYTDEVNERKAKERSKEKP